MKNPMKYGDPPFRIAVIHGGPGGNGSEVLPVARELSAHHGVLVPIQTANTLEGQAEELKALIDDHAAVPAVLIGYSLGASNGLLFQNH